VRAGPTTDIVKRYGDQSLWGQDYTINLPHLVQDDRKEYYLEVEVPRSKQPLMDHQRVRVIVEAQLVAQQLVLGSAEKKTINVHSELKLSLYSENEEILIESISNERLEVGYLRAKGAEFIRQARELARDGNFAEAQRSLEDFLKEIDACTFREARGLQFLRSDIEKSKDSCKPQVFA
jgi:hypothetical protein